MFDVPPKCPALADKLTGLFSWRQTYRVQHRQKGITHTSYLSKRHSSLTLSRSGSSDRAADTSTTVKMNHNKKMKFSPLYLSIV